MHIRGATCPDPGATCRPARGGGDAGRRRRALLGFAGSGNLFWGGVGEPPPPKMAPRRSKRSTKSPRRRSKSAGRKRRSKSGGRFRGGEGRYRAEAAALVYDMVNAERLSSQFAREDEVINAMNAALRKMDPRVVSQQNRSLTVQELLETLCPEEGPQRCTAVLQDLPISTIQRLSESMNWVEAGKEFGLRQVHL